MTRTIIRAIGIALALVALCVGVRLLHLGPFYVRPGDYILLAHTALPDGQRFFAIGHRTESLTEPYEVTLYKVQPDNRTSLYYLAFEDSYWWKCSIRPNNTSGEVEIWADGGIAARYLPAKNLVLSDSYKVPQPEYAMHYWQLEELLARARR